MDQQLKGGSRKNIWHGLGRQRIEIPRTVLKAKVHSHELLRQLHVCSLGYYPRAEGHYTYRKKGLPENFLFYCVDGNGWYKLGDRQYKVGPNEFFILPANVEHSYGSTGPHPWSIYWVHFGGAGLAAFNELGVVRNHQVPSYIKATGEVFTVFSKMYKTLELGYSQDNLLFANICLQHFLSLFIYNAKHFPEVSETKDDCVEQAIRYMQEHLHDNISLGELCSLYNYSTSRFSNLFKTKTGYAPIDYFIQMKMQRASQELDFSDKSIKVIASEMGFDDPYYFSRRFRKIIGMSPAKYRSIKKD